MLRSRLDELDAQLGELQERYAENARQRGLREKEIEAQESQRREPWLQREERHRERAMDRAGQRKEQRRRDLLQRTADVDSGMQEIARTYETTVGRPDCPLYPPDCCFLPACESFIRSVRNQMASTLGEAVRLYEESLFRDQVLKNQQMQLASLMGVQE
ncbi:MAG: hypothetical protein LKG38_05365 [Atopobiaceae bacterium]|jgi:hypothetical protein|nr:hypothetical protein [Atopobiaceae bacterium]MCH4120254.1 hypothetical protein [Atopobiaceae bacterium]MCI1318752.1 hypothetical protein [Atopobiaceae bacterium]MCI1388906.1 hypothetical protein [Atopobiaceae bacterium]MCI1431860.1 hypothetical protein [Atopobiaceae bacterium]